MIFADVRTPAVSVGAGRARLLAVVLVVGFALALGIRVWAGQPQVSQSAPAGLLFAACLVLLSVAYGARLPVSWRSIGVGMLGGAVLCLPVVARNAGELGAHRPGGSFLSWALVVGIVAVAEEVFLRGALFSAVERAASEPWAIGVSAVAFGVLHVPLYGWGALPLDLAVGVWLGALRALTGSVSAPAAAHVVADLTGWWLR